MNFGNSCLVCIRKEDYSSRSYGNIKMRLLTTSRNIFFPLWSAHYIRNDRTAITTTKYTPSKAEESFNRSKQTFWPFICSIRPPQQYPPATPSVLFDWALISFTSSRLIRDRNPTPRLKVTHIYIYT